MGVNLMQEMTPTIVENVATVVLQIMPSHVNKDNAVGAVVDGLILMETEYAQIGANTMNKKEM